MSAGDEYTLYRRDFGAGADSGADSGAASPSPFGDMTPESIAASANAVAADYDAWWNDYTRSRGLNRHGLPDPEAKASLEPAGSGRDFGAAGSPERRESIARLRDQAEYVRRQLGDDFDLGGGDTAKAAADMLSGRFDGIVAKSTPRMDAALADIAGKLEAHYRTAKENRGIGEVFVDGVARAVDDTRRLAENIYNLGAYELGGRTKERMFESYRKSQEEAERWRALHPAQVESVTDIDGVGSALTWATEKVAEQSVNLVSGIGAGMGARYVVKRGANKAMEAALKRGLEGAARKIARDAAARAATAGVVAGRVSGAAFNLGDVAGTQIEEAEARGGDPSLARTLAETGLYTAIDEFGGVQRALRRAGGADMAKLAQREARKAFLVSGRGWGKTMRRAAGAWAKDALGEGAGEALQSGVVTRAGNLLQYGTALMDGEKDWRDAAGAALEEFAAGAVVGGATGAVSVGSTVRDQTRQTRDADAVLARYESAARDAAASESFQNLDAYDRVLAARAINDAIAARQAGLLATHFEVSGDGALRSRQESRRADLQRAMDEAREAMTPAARAWMDKYLAQFETLSPEQAGGGAPVDERGFPTNIDLEAIEENRRAEDVGQLEDDSGAGLFYTDQTEADPNGSVAFEEFVEDGEVVIRVRPLAGVLPDFGGNEFHASDYEGTGAEAAAKARSDAMRYAAGLKAFNARVAEQDAQIAKWAQDYVERNAPGAGRRVFIVRNAEQLQRVAQDLVKGGGPDIRAAVDGALDDTTPDGFRYGDQAFTDPDSGVIAIYRSGFSSAAELGALLDHEGFHADFAAQAAGSAGREEVRSKLRNEKEVDTFGERAYRDRVRAEMLGIEQPEMWTTAFHDQVEAAEEERAYAAERTHGGAQLRLTMLQRLAKKDGNMVMRLGARQARALGRPVESEQELADYVYGVTMAGRARNAGNGTVVLSRPIDLDAKVEEEAFRRKMGLRSDGEREAAARGAERTMDARDIQAIGENEAEKERVAADTATAAPAAETEAAAPAREAEQTPPPAPESPATTASPAPAEEAAAPEAPVAPEDRSVASPSSTPPVAEAAEETQSAPGEQTPGPAPAAPAAETETKVSENPTGSEDPNGSEAESPAAATVEGEAAEPGPAPKAEAAPEEKPETKREKPEEKAGKPEKAEPAPEKAAAPAQEETVANPAPAADRSLGMPEDSRITPTQREYRRRQNDAPDALLLTREGDFYVAYGDNAGRVRDVLRIPVTRSQGVDKAAIPANVLDEYRGRLDEAGVKTALVEAEPSAAAPALKAKPAETAATAEPSAARGMRITPPQTEKEARASERAAKREAAARKRRSLVASPATAAPAQTLRNLMGNAETIMRFWTDGNGIPATDKEAFAFAERINHFAKGLQEKERNDLAAVAGKYAKAIVSNVAGDVPASEVDLVRDEFSDFLGRLGFDGWEKPPPVRLPGETREAWMQRTAISEQTAPASAAGETAPNAAQSSRDAEIGELRRKIERYRAALDEWAARRDESPEMDRRGEVEQIRLSEAISRNEARLAELEGGAPEKSPAVRHSGAASAGAIRVTPADDAAYMDAVKRGDMKKAQSLVRKVAKRILEGSIVQSGVWHSTKKKFTVFQNRTPNVFFFARDKKWAEAFGKKERYAKPEDTKEYYVNIRNPLDMMDEKTGTEWLDYFHDKGIEIGEAGVEKLRRMGNNQLPGWAILNHDMSEPYGTGFRDAMLKAGYDGVVFEDVAFGKNDRTTYGAFQAHQIKSADPVTYDDDGNVIPLSRRFDGGDDIRFSGGRSAGAIFGGTVQVRPDGTMDYSMVKDALLKRTRILQGRPEFQFGSERRSLRRTAEIAASMIERDPEGAQALIDRALDAFESGREWVPSDTEFAVLSMEEVLRELRVRDAENAVRACEEGRGDQSLVDAQAALAQARADQLDFAQALAMTGKTTGRALSARRFMISDDYSFGGVVDEVVRIIRRNRRLRGADGRTAPLMTEEAAEIESYVKLIQDLSDGKEKAERELKHANARIRGFEAAARQRRVAEGKVKRGERPATVEEAVHAIREKLADSELEMLDPVDLTVWPELWARMNRNVKILADAVLGEMSGGGGDLTEEQYDAFLRRLHGAVTEAYADVRFVSSDPAHGALTVEDVRDMFCDYGDPDRLLRGEREPSDALSTLRSRMRSLSKLRADLERVVSGEIPLKAFDGARFKTLEEAGAELERVKAEMRDAFRQSGLSSDYLHRMRTPVDRAKARISARMEELRAAIAAKEEILRGKPVPRKETADLNRMREELKDLQEDYALMLDDAKTDDQRIDELVRRAQERADAAERSLLELQARGLGRRHVRPADMNRAMTGSVLPQMTDAQREALAGARRRARDAAREARAIREEAYEGGRYAEERALEESIRRREERARQWDEAVAAGRIELFDPARSPRRPQLDTLNERWLAADRALRVAKMGRDRLAAKIEYERLDGLGKAISLAGAGINMMRQLLASGDMSAIGVQCAVAVLSDPKTGAGVVAPGVKAFWKTLRGDDSFCVEFMQKLKEDPDYARLVQAGLGMAEINADGSFANTEEMFRQGYATERLGELMQRALGLPPGNAAQKWGGRYLKASEAAFNLPANAIRFALAKRLLSNLREARGGSNASVTDAEVAEISRLANAATGRGDWFGHGEMNSALSKVLWAPARVSGQLQSLALPLTLLTNPTLRGAADLRGVVARELIVRPACNYAAALLLLSAARALFRDKDDDDPAVVFDPLSGKFLKVKIGSKYVSLTGNLESYLHLAAKCVVGARLSGAGNRIDLRSGFGGSPSGEVFRFFKNKLNPHLGMAFQLMDGSSVGGEPIHWRLWGEGNVLNFLIGNSVIPLTYGDIAEAWLDVRENGVPLTAALSALAFVGMGGSDYGETPFSRDRDRIEAARKAMSAARDGVEGADARLAELMRDRHNARYLAIAVGTDPQSAEIRAGIRRVRELRDAIKNGEATRKGVRILSRRKLSAAEERRAEREADELEVKVHKAVWSRNWAMPPAP